MNKKIVVVGDCSTDHFLVMGADNVGLIHHKNEEQICFNFGEKLPIKQVFKSFGGSALNVASSLGNLGVDVEIVGFTGKDFEGHEVIGQLHSNNVSTDGMIMDQKTNQSFIIVFDEGYHIGV